jgi:hypothetical protein
MRRRKAARPMVSIVWGIALQCGLVAGICTSSVAQSPTQRWKRIDADNGSTMAIDLNSISHMSNANGATDAIICYLDGNTCPLLNQRRWRFDCHGHFINIDGAGGLVVAPPQSVAGQLADIACKSTKNELSAVTRPQNNAVTEAFGACLQYEGEKGSFATTGPAFEGGRAVLDLIGKCDTQWKAWHNECVARGGTDGGPGGCTTKAYILAYGALKIIGK